MSEEASTVGAAVAALFLSESTSPTRSSFTDQKDQWGVQEETDVVVDRL